MGIIDGHLHVFSQINGANLRGPVTGTGYGRIQNAGETSFFMPPMNETTCFTVSMALQLLAQHGVEGAVLMQNPTIGNVNAEVGEAIRKYPDRLAGVTQVDPYDPEAVDKLNVLAASYPFAALKLELSTGWGWTGIYHDEGFRYDRIYPLVETARERGLAVVIDTGDTASYAYRPCELLAMAREFKDVLFVIEHGAYLTPEGDPRLWLDMVDVALLDNVLLGVCAMPGLMGEPFPCPVAEMMLRYLARRVGCRKLIWGTDAPTTLKAFSYGQLLELASRCTPFLSTEEQEAMMGENARQVYFS